MAIVTPAPAPANVVTTQDTQVVGLSVPFIYGDSGSVAANGADTLGTALPVAYPNAYKWYPAGAVFAGSLAGWYFIQMSSTTAATIFNNVYVAGTQPTIPASPTPVVAAGPGAYTATTGATTGPSFPVNAGMCGPNGGAVELTMMVSVNNTAGNKIPLLSIGGVTLVSSTLTTTTGNVYEQTVFVRGQPSATQNPAYQNQQAAFGAVAGALGAQTPAYSAATGLLVNPNATPPTLLVSLNVAVATDFIVLEGMLAEMFYCA